MKKFTLALFLLSCAAQVRSQITTPVIKANFGVDADLRANIFNGAIVSGNDDWFSDGTAGTGGFVIDTTGAAALLALYASTPSSRLQSFWRTMSVPWYSLMNNRLVIDGGFIRDHHGMDSTAFAIGSNKNGMSPANWTSTGAQSVPSKNEILDVFIHLRRDGPAVTDSLWFFGGISLDDNVGNRYFDFELYQTDISFSMATSSFSGYGADSGHTAWQFDGAGNITRPGDIIFSAEYGATSLTMIEARIWVDTASLSITPANFDWTGQTDGASVNSKYVYASIGPKSGGTFYTGLQSAANTWAGDFGLVLKSNTVVSNYNIRQFMEFSVNLSKLGLDPIVLSGDACGSPFRRVLIKSRAATAFSAELKDFVGPLDLFNVTSASVAADFPTICGAGSISTLQVTNPVSTSIYNWTTPDGRIVGSTSGASVNVDTAGTYVVTQQLQSACSVYATDTIVIAYDGGCIPLNNLQIKLNGERKDRSVNLQWTVNQNSQVNNFVTERSLDGISFTEIQTIPAQRREGETAIYSGSDNVNGIHSNYIYYRLKINGHNNSAKYSEVIRVYNASGFETELILNENPVKDKISLSVTTAADDLLTLHLFDNTGKLVYTTHKPVQRGTSLITIPVQARWTNGLYMINARTRQTGFTRQVILVK